ncbi:MAG: hypothetical protein MI810_05410 [Flavobacteriales bacterium]|nr:hypothetical protein [Flavobacteriales bacterium]
MTLKLIVLASFSFLLMACESQRDKVEEDKKKEEKEVIQETEELLPEVELSDANPEWEGFLALFPNYEIGAEIKQYEDIPFRMAKKYLYDQVADVLFMLLEDDATEYPEGEYMKSCGKVERENYTILIFYANFHPNMTYGKGDFLATFRHDGSIIDYSYLNVSTFSPKAGGEFMTNHTSIFKSDNEIEQLYETISIYSTDIEEDEYDEKGIDHSYSEKMVTVTDSTYYQMTFDENGQMTMDEIEKRPQAWVEDYY